MSSALDESVLKQSILNDVSHTSTKLAVKENIKHWILSFKKHKGKVSKIQPQIDTVLYRHFFCESGCDWNTACREAGLDEEEVLEIPLKSRTPGRKRRKGWYSKKRAEWCKQKAKAWLVHECKPCTARDIRDAASAFRLNPEALQKYLLRQQNKKPSKKRKRPPLEKKEKTYWTSHAPVPADTQSASAPNVSSAGCSGQGLITTSLIACNNIKSKKQKTTTTTTYKEICPFSQFCTCLTTQSFYC